MELKQDVEKATEEDDTAELLALMGQALELENKMSDLEDEISELGDEFERVQEDLSPATHKILEEADCLYACLERTSSIGRPSGQDKL